MPRDLTADRGDALSLDPNSAPMGGGGSDAYGLVAALAEEDEPDTEEGDPEAQEVEEDPDQDEEIEDPEDEDVEPNEKGAGKTDAEIDLGEHGTYEASELVEALTAQQHLLEIEADYETLSTQRTEIEGLAQELDGTMRFQEMLNTNPLIGNAVRGALLNLMKTNPEVASAIEAGAAGVFGGQRQANIPPALLQRLEKLEGRERQNEVERHGQTIDSLFGGYKKQFGEGWKPGLEERILRSAISTYGRNLTPQALKDHTDATIHRMGLKPRQSTSDPERIERAMRAQGKTVRLVKTGASRRSVSSGNARMPDTTKMSDRQFEKYLSSQI